MKILGTYRLTTILVISFLSLNASLLAQTFTLQKSASQMAVFGTSNLHDWELTVENMQGTIEVKQEGNVLKSISKLDLSILAESLKSGKNGMDKNTFKALNTKDYQNITYKLKSVESINAKNSGEYTVNTTGDLMLAGVTKPISLVFDAKIVQSKITLSGEKEINMTDYKIEPPKALFGTITTGEKVIIKFKATFTN
ncbi:YceI family protein [Leeuwenhoekiella sp. A16]|uniref:YceI family protein n=1 Tax=unclassified Leeuwenhoekiella TaxID=2615029 RepID=UPI003A7FBC6C